LREIFDDISNQTSRLTTQAYSTSFTMGIRLLHQKFHQPIYNVYGFVRLADEIVDTFLEQDKKQLLDEFKAETHQSIERGISLNPILNAFQNTVNTYNIELELIDTFLDSMYMDLEKIDYDTNTYEKYILGSAEVVGLMCLRIFTEGDGEEYEKLKPTAMSLGSAFQKVNFLRDIKADSENLGRMYFPDVDKTKFSNVEKQQIEKDILQDFNHAIQGIKQLPNGARLGVYAAYVFYKALFNKIKSTSPQQLLNKRVRISNFNKFVLMVQSYFKHQLNILS